MVGLSLSAPETAQVKMLPVCPTIRGVLKLTVTMTVMGGAIGIENMANHKDSFSYVPVIMSTVFTYQSH